MHAQFITTQFLTNFDTGATTYTNDNACNVVIQETVWLGDTPILTIRPDSLQRNADNTDTATTNKAVKTGTWTSATTLKGFYGSNYLSHAAAASTTDKVTYTITPTATQNFRIYTRWVAQATNASNATYTIAPNTAGSTPSVISLDQTQAGGAWVYLGSYNLNTAKNLTVTLSGQGNGTVVADAIRITPNTPTNIQNDTFLVYADQLNTPRLIKSYTNQTRWYWYPELSEAFGANLPNDNPQSLGIFTYNLRFPGQIYDPTSGLSSNGYRMYNSRNDRYLTSDLIGLGGGINTYGYVGGNPMSYTDPSSEKSLGSSAIGAAIGAALEIAMQGYENYQNDCDVLDADNYDWFDVGVSSAVGAVAPGLLSVGKTVKNSSGAISTLSRQLKNARSANRIAKLEGRLANHQEQIAQRIVEQVGFQGIKKIWKMAEHQNDDKNCKCNK